MQAADLGQLDHLTGFGRHHHARVGPVLVEGQMRARAVVVDEVGCEESAQIASAEDDHVVEAISADGSDQSLDERIFAAENAARS